VIGELTMDYGFNVHSDVINATHAISCNDKIMNWDHQDQRMPTSGLKLLRFH